MNDFDFGSIVSNIEKVKQMKASKSKKPSTSIKPLKFDSSPEDSPLKAEIIRRINSKNLTYSDIHQYCAEVCNGDIEAGKSMGNNIIRGLKTRHTMLDTSLSLLCDFLDLDIKFVERNIETTDDDDE